jgi:hypothetical protein
MQKTSKILIMVMCVVLVAIFSVNNLNQTNNDGNGSYMSASKAMRIANDVSSGNNLKATGATLVQSNPDPYYLVSMWNTKTNTSGGTVRVDAKEGPAIPIPI